MSEKKNGFLSGKRETQMKKSHLYSSVEFQKLKWVAKIDTWRRGFEEKSEMIWKMKQWLLIELRVHRSRGQEEGISEKSVRCLRQQICLHSFNVAVLLVANAL